LCHRVFTGLIGVFKHTVNGSKLQGRWNKTEDNTSIRRFIMNRLPYLKVIPIVVVMAVCLVGTQSIAGEEVCTSKGQIETIDCACNTVAVEVLLGNTYFTIRYCFRKERTTGRVGRLFRG